MGTLGKRLEFVGEEVIQYETSLALPTALQNSQADQRAGPGRRDWRDNFCISSATFTCQTISDYFHSLFQCLRGVLEWRSSARVHFYVNTSLVESLAYILTE
jgi:hypothetical protein